MELKLPVFADATSLAEVDAFLRRDGVFPPLKRVFDSDGPRLGALDARIDQMRADAERIAAAHRLIAAIAEMADRVLAAHEHVAPMAAARSSRILGRLVGLEREAALKDEPEGMPPMDARNAERWKALRRTPARHHLTVGRSTCIRRAPPRSPIWKTRAGASAGSTGPGRRRFADLAA